MKGPINDLTISMSNFLITGIDVASFAGINFPGGERDL